MLLHVSTGSRKKRLIPRVIDNDPWYESLYLRAAAPPSPRAIPEDLGDESSPRSSGIRWPPQRIQVSRRSVSRVLSACAVRPFLWDRFHNLPQRDQPGRRNGNVSAGLCRHSQPAAPIRSCSRWGLPCQFRYRNCGALLPHRFTLTLIALRRFGRFVFCGTFPGVAPAGR